MDDLILMEIVKPLKDLNSIGFNLTFRKTSIAFQLLCNASLLHIFHIDIQLFIDYFIVFVTEDIRMLTFFIDSKFFLKAFLNLSIRIFM